MEALAPILFVLILAINGVISFLNCRTAGRAWKDTMAVGSWFEKALLWSAALQSTIGFSMLILIPGAFGLTAYLSAGEHPTLTPDEARMFLEQMFSLWWLAVIFPAVGSGTIIWVHSIRVAIQTRRAGDIAVATWNTFAQVMNTISLFKNLGENLTNVKELFGGLGSDKKNALAIAAIMLVVVSIIAGALITAALIAYYANRSRSVVEEKLKRAA